MEQKDTILKKKTAKKDIQRNIMKKLGVIVPKKSTEKAIEKIDIPKVEELKDEEFVIEKRAKIKTKISTPLLKTIKIESSYFDKKKVREHYSLMYPYSFALIEWNHDKEDLVYNIIEPPLSPELKTKVMQIKSKLVERFNINFSTIKNKIEAEKILENKIDELLQTSFVDNTSTSIIKYYLFRIFTGYDKIAGLMHDPNVSEISCIGDKLTVLHKKYGALKTNISFKEKELNPFIAKLSIVAGKDVSPEKPTFISQLPDGTFIQGNIGVVGGTAKPSFLIKKVLEPLSFFELSNDHLLTDDIAAYLWLLVENNFSGFIIGESTTGKSAMLNFLATLIKSDAKIVSLEYRKELDLQQENWLSNVVSLKLDPDKKFNEELLNWKPTHLLFGDILEEEAKLFFKYMALGHTCYATLNAQSIDEMAKKLKSFKVNHSLISNISFIITTSSYFDQEEKKDVYRVESIDELIRYSGEENKIVTKKVIQFDKENSEYIFNLTNSQLLYEIASKKSINMNDIIENIQERKLVLDWTKRSNIKSTKSFFKVINEYRLDKEKFLEKYHLKK